VKRSPSAETIVMFSTSAPAPAPAAAEEEEEAIVGS
jgi:hypothetical protein